MANKMTPKEIEKIFGISISSSTKLEKRLKKLNLDKKYLDKLLYSSYKKSKNGTFGIIVCRPSEDKVGFVILVEEEKRVLWVEECNIVDSYNAEVSDDGTVFFVTGYSYEEKRKMLEKMLKNKNVIIEKHLEYDATYYILGNKIILVEGDDISVAGGFLNVKTVDGSLLLRYEFDSNVAAIAVSNDCKFFACSTAFSDNSIYCFDLDKRQLMWKYKNHVRKVALGLSFSEDGKSILVETGGSIATKSYSYSLDALNGKLCV
jgi:WD40 repeat protein